MKEKLYKYPFKVRLSTTLMVVSPFLTIFIYAFTQNIMLATIGFGSSLFFGVISLIFVNNMKENVWYE